MPNTKNLPLISVITAIYNAESHLSATLDSILYQSYKNIEVLLINDGSTDNSKSICDEYVQKDKRVKLINQKNSGVASARNTGLKNSHGAFLIHVDSDDILLPHALINLYQGIIENNSDLSIGNYIIRYPDHDIVFEQQATQHSDEFLTGILIGKYHSGLWNKLIKQELYNGISFLDGLNYMEDKLLLTKVLLKGPKINFVNINVYIYKQTRNSYSTNISRSSIESSYLITRILCEILKNNSKSNEIITHLKLKHKILALLNSKDKISNIFKESNKHIFQDKFIPKKYKLLLLLESVNISCFSNLYKKLK